MGETSEKFKVFRKFIIIFFLKKKIKKFVVKLCKICLDTEKILEQNVIDFLFFFFFNQI